MAASSSKRQLKLTAFYFPPGSHSGGWRMPGAIAESDMEFEHYVRLARLVEAGKMDALFFQDTAALPRSNALARGETEWTASIRCSYLEPMTLLPALAAVTTHLGLVATATTTYNEPFHVARKFATIDHISKGRAGWNLVTSQSEDEAQNFGQDTHMDHDLRYERASEFFDVVTGLWDSWEEGALIRDKKSGVYYDQSRVHLLQHRGKYFSVRGPLNIERTPQGRPIVAQAGSSGPGRELAAKTADLVFTAQTKLADAQEFYRDVRGRTEKFGRQPDDVKILPGIIPIIGRTEEEARARNEMLQSLIPEDLALAGLMRLSGGLDLRKYPLDGPLPDLPPANTAQARQQMLINLARTENLSIRQLAQRFATGTGHHAVVGTPVQIADMMEEWVMNGGADGFTILFPYFPQPVEDFVNLVIPELQRRGIFRTEYEGATLRENLGLRMPVNRYQSASRSAAE